MFQCPVDIRDRLASLDKSTDYVQKRSWKAEKQYEIAHAKHLYILRLVSQISEEDPKFAMLTFRCNEAAAKTDRLKDKLDEAKEEVIYFTLAKLELMVATYSDPGNFLDGIPYLD